MKKQNKQDIGSAWLYKISTRLQLIIIFITI